jgi:hypothetical protein
MKTLSEPNVLNPTILLLGTLAMAVVILVMKGAQLPLLSNPKVTVGLLLVLGMGMCTQGGIGRIAASGQWTHPLAILGYALGAAILILAAAVFFNIRLPFISSQSQAVLIIAALIGAKVVNAVAHYYLLGHH